MGLAVLKVMQLVLSMFLPIRLMLLLPTLEFFWLPGKITASVSMGKQDGKKGNHTPKSIFVINHNR
jgi:hypothetical protein